MIKAISFFGYSMLAIQIIVFMFILNPWDGVAFKNDSVLARSFTVYPYIVHEDEDQIIIGSKIIDNYWVYDLQGNLEKVYTIPGSGVTYARYENDNLEVYEVRSKTIYTISTGGTVAAEQAELSDVQIDAFKDTYDGSATVKNNFIKQLVFRTSTNDRIVLEHNSTFVLIYYVLSSLLITGALYNSYNELKMEFQSEGQYQSLVSIRFSTKAVMCIITGVVVLGYIATILLLIPITLYTLDIFNYQFRHHE